MPSLKRGDIVRVRLDPVEGSEQAGERPALVISPDVINEHSPVILIAALTSQKTERVYPFEFLGQSNRPPSSASPTTWRSGSWAAIPRMSARNRALSSTIKMVATMAPVPPPEEDS